MTALWAWKRLTAITIAVLVMTGAASCGQNEFTYVRDREGTTYFKVPATFAQVESYGIDLFLSGDNPESESARLAKQRVWSTAFDQATEPTPEHLISSTEPFVYATVHKLTEDQVGAISMNRLRDFFLPVTKDLRGALEQQAAMAGREMRFTKFELLADDLLSLEGGARGVHVRFNYEFQGKVQTYDLTSLLDEKGATVSALVISCHSLCFRARAGEFDKIKDSFKLIRMPG
ncbi:hypothetical protein [Nonomuraea soli]|uniref:Lipoprotein n=1 Tax=Nonomuraea soli TaxID=1032476 RepID=A0A7W0CPB8_9ACTN|nr:hypothetical protein [Nonomuraea soli]MBA2894737.1 hypothetical protein [Nonomuraea soli]